jgi:hypothetical protein
MLFLNYDQQNIGWKKEMERRLTVMNDFINTDNDDAMSLVAITEIYKVLMKSSDYNEFNEQDMETIGRHLEMDDSILQVTDK